MLSIARLPRELKKRDMPCCFVLSSQLRLYEPHIDEVLSFFQRYGNFLNTFY